MKNNKHAFASPKNPPSKQLLSLLITAAIVANANVAGVQAATNEWIGGISSDWSNQDNWSLNILPSKVNGTVINNGNVVLDTSGSSINLGVGIAPGSEASLTVGQGNTLTLGTAVSAQTTDGVGQYIGHDGSGKLVIENGGEVNYSSTLTTILGNNAGSNGEVIVTGAGSTWSNLYGDVQHPSNQTVIKIGNAGSGQLSVLNGGTVVTPRGFSIASAEGSYGSVTVSGVGSSLLLGTDQLNSTGWAGVSMLYGEGHMTVSHGGEATIYGGIIFGRGNNGVAQTVTVSGENSVLTHYGNLNIYGNGAGVLLVEDGAKLYTSAAPGGGTQFPGQAIVGHQNGGDAFAYVTGPDSLWQAAQDMIVGNQANGNLIISNGGTVENVLGRVGLTANYTGTITVTGMDSVWNNRGNITLGNAGTGILTVADNGVVNVGDKLTIANLAGSKGILNFGAAENSAAATTGTVNANQIVFGDGDGRVVFNHTENDYQFTHLLSGTGTVVAHNGVTIFNDQQTYGGLTEIHDGGTLRAGENNAFSTNSIYDIAQGGILDLAGYRQTTGDITNAGTIKFHTGEIARGNTHNLLTIEGNYHSDGGEIVYNTLLGDDGSATDQLVVNGDTSGTGYIRVINAGGGGAQTLNGIKIIDVLGQSDGEFYKAQNHRIVAGAYEYDVIRGSQADTNKNWYLTSSCVNGQGSCDVTTPDPQVDKPAVIPEKPVEIFRPEAATYSANLAMANTLFTHSLHDRLGEPQYTDSLRGQTQHPTSMWLRIVGGHTRSRDSTGQMHTQTNRVVVHGGGEIANWSSDGLDRGHLGLMFGYGQADSNSDSRITGYSTRGKVDGYSAGVYGTWYSNNIDKTGLYVDSWAQYNWFNNEIQGQYIGTEKYNSDGVVLSLESGYTFQIMDNQAENKKAFIQPQAQVVWMNVSADDHTEGNNAQAMTTTVSGRGDGNIMTRLGVRAYLQGYHPIDEGKDRIFQPFIETNWIHNTKAFGANLNGVKVEQKGTRDLGELKLGVEGQLTKQFSVWSNVSQRLGGDGYSDTAGLVGMKYSF